MSIFYNIDRDIGIKAKGPTTYVSMCMMHSGKYAVFVAIRLT